MPAALFEHLDEEIGGAIEDTWMITEARGAVDVAFDADDPDDLFEITAGGGMELSDGVECGLAGGPVAILNPDAIAELAGIEHGFALPGKLAGGDDEVAGAGPGEIIADGGGGLGKSEPEALEVFKGGHSSRV